MHYADNPEYAGDWWLHHGFEYPYEVYDEAVDVERAREAGVFQTQADYDAAYAKALHLGSPDQYYPRIIEQAGLRALIPHTISAERLAELQLLCAKHVVHSEHALWEEAFGDIPPMFLDEPKKQRSALMVLSLERDYRVRPRQRWSSSHPVVVALLSGELDGALTLPELAHARVNIALTEKSRRTLTEHPELLNGLEVNWMLLRALTTSGETVHAVYNSHAESFWHSRSLWSAPARDTLVDTLDDPELRGLITSAGAALISEGRRTNNAIREVKRFLEATDGTPPNGSDATAPGA